MSHVDDELVAGFALGEPDRLDPDDQTHLLTCPTCSVRLRELQEVVGLGRSGRPAQWRPPSPGVLAAIQAELAADVTAGAASEEPSEPVVPPAPTALAERRRRRSAGGWGARRFIAAAAVLAVAVGGAVWYRASTAEVVVASTTLAPLPDKTGGGTARLTERDGDLRLTIEVTRPASTDAFEELWLINTDGQRMISLGVLPATGRASYPVPVNVPDLDTYTVVDISLEPFDGDAVHSQNSLLRGTLA
ncbi:hypothetical protein GCM10009616_35450 [Microlunatus lacustris]